jgi:hypothetical protein
MKQYNPAKNLQWNKIDKKWRNHTIYDEIFNEIYPPLLPKEDEDRNKK